MIIRFAMLALAAALTGCSALTARGTPPIWTGASQFDLNQTVSCVIKGLNVATHSDSPLASLGTRITHQAVIIEPDRVMEVAPQQTITVGAEIYYVRLTAVSKSHTNIKLFGPATWSERLRGGVVACAKQ